MARATIPGAAPPPLPSGTNLPSGRYSLNTVAYDRYNNASATNTVYVRVGPNDVTAPTASITWPAAGASLSRLTQVTGTVNDPNNADGSAGVGVARVRVSLRQITGGVHSYWNGSSFVSGYTSLPSDTEFGWSRTQGLPAGGALTAGTYYAYVDSFDRDNNLSTVFRSFSIVANTRPTSSAQSVTVSHGLATAVTLSATDTQGDALSYRVATQPAHGTLSGTAPALTYTPTAGYSGADSFTFAASDWEGEGATATVSLSVTANARPVASAQSVSVAYETSTAITLAATDADGDAITAYRVVTQPTHGMLSGTAPSLTYVPNAGFGGSDSFTFAASDSGGEGAAATVTLTVASPLPLDALLAPGSSTTTPLPMSSFVGLGIANTTGENQSVTRSGDAGSGTDFTVLLRNGIGSDDVIVTAAAMADGWSASYFYGTTDITADVQGNGWTHSFATDDEARLRVVVNPSATAAEGASKELLIHARNATANTSEDAVKAILSAHAVAQPDLEIKLASEIQYVGSQVINTTGANQTKSFISPIQTTQTFDLRVKNSSDHIADMVISAETTPQNWVAKYFDALTGGTEVTSSVTSTNGWHLTSMQVGETREFRVEIAAGSPTPADHPFLITASGGGLAKDVVKAEVLAQSIQSIVYNTDGTDTFLPLPSDGVITVSQGAPFTLRAIPAHERDPDGDLDWPIVGDETKPTWTNLSQNNLKAYGSRVSYQQNALTGSDPQSYAEIQVECGNVKTVKVQVLSSDAREVDLWQEFMLETSSTGAKRRLVGGLVTDGFGNPVVGATVTLQGTGLTIVGNSTLVTGAGGYFTFTVESTGGDTGSVKASTVGNNPTEPNQDVCAINFQ